MHGKTDNMGGEKLGAAKLSASHHLNGHNPKKKYHIPMKRKDVKALKKKLADRLIIFTNRGKSSCCILE